MNKVLFTGGGGAGNEALWRLLEARYELHFGDADIGAIDPSIPLERRHKLPWASDAAYLPKMIDLCRRLRIDVLVPGVDEELLILALGRTAFAPTVVLLPDADYIAAMTDKLTMVRRLETGGIIVPRTMPIDQADDWFGFPCISKPRSGRGSRDVRILTGKDEARALRDALGSLAGQSVLQEKIEGIEYTIQMVANASGELHAIVPVRVVIKRGITLRAMTENNADVVAACRAIHRAIPTGGCYNIQLILTNDGKAVPFEINPRVSTTLCLVVAAGVDPIAIYRSDVATDTIATFTAGLKLQRYWRNVFTEAALET